MVLGCEAGPLDDVGTGLGPREAAVRLHAGLQIPAKDAKEFSGCFRLIFFCQPLIFQKCPIAKT